MKHSDHLMLTSGPTTRPATEDTFDWTFLWFWLAFMVPFLVCIWFFTRAMLAFSMPPVIHHHGEATVNARGDVVEWTSEAAGTTGKREMFGANVFSLMPESRRGKAQREFDSWVSGAPHCEPQFSWPQAGGTVTVTFARRGDVTLATFTR